MRVALHTARGRGDGRDGRAWGASAARAVERRCIDDGRPSAGPGAQDAPLLVAGRCSCGCSSQRLAAHNSHAVLVAAAPSCTRAICDSRAERGRIASAPSEPPHAHSACAVLRCAMGRPMACPGARARARPRPRTRTHCAAHAAGRQSHRPASPAALGAHSGTPFAEPAASRGRAISWSKLGPASSCTLSQIARRLAAARRAHAHGAGFGQRRPGL